MRIKKKKSLPRRLPPGGKTGGLRGGFKNEAKGLMVNINREGLIGKVSQGNIDLTKGNKDPDRPVWKNALVLDGTSAGGCVPGKDNRNSKNPIQRPAPIQKRKRIHLPVPPDKKPKPEKCP